MTITTKVLRLQIAELKEYGKTYDFNNDQLQDLLEACNLECLLVNYEKSSSNGIEDNLNGFWVYQLLLVGLEVSF